MNSRDSESAPERLIHGKYGNLLREANREFEAGFDERAAFHRIEERLTASRRRRLLSKMPWLVPAAPLAVTVLLTLLVLAHQRRSNAAPELVAETWQPAKRDPQPPNSAATTISHAEATALPSGRAAKEGPQAKRNAGPTSGRPSASGAAERGRPATADQPAPPVVAEPPSAATEPRSVAEPPSVASDSGPKVEENVAPPDCLDLARHGQTREAEACFLKRAQGSGLAAEMALYEVARLRRDVLADANGALGALAEYRRRFPAGSLRREADMSQLELLLQLGRVDDALRQSDELLSSSASGERATELRLLRGHILRKQSRFAAAVREYELAESTGARAGEATYFRALCLEALGRSSEAVTLFSKYLEQPQRPYAEDARRRLRRLAP